MVNGKTWPFLQVAPRRYRFRFLNGSNARFYTLQIQTLNGQGTPVFWQIGTDGGLLDKPVKVNQLTISPGERADVIVDFGGIKQGAQFILRNSAKAPFPGGATPDPQTVGQIMRIDVALQVPPGFVDNSFNPSVRGATLRSGTNAIVKLASAGALAAGVTPNKVRQLTLNEVVGAGGPLELLLNNTKWYGNLSPNAGGITELPQVGSTEVWEIINISADTHPIHLHGLQFQLLNRQAIQTSKYMKAYNAAFLGATFPDPATGNDIVYLPGVYIPAYGPPKPYNTFPNPGAPIPTVGGNPDVKPFLVNGPKLPDPNEAGWKDTVRMNPGEVTRIVARWAPLDVQVGGVSPGQNLYPYDPTSGPGYVWHCHILDHEDNEMMRPYKVI